MTRTIILHEAAERDLAGQATYLAQKSRRASHRFLDAVEKSLGFLAVMPETGSPCEFRSAAAAGLRWSLVRRFKKHVIFYRYTAATLEVIRVLQGARDLEAIIGQLPP